MIRMKHHWVYYELISSDWLLSLNQMSVCLIVEVTKEQYWGVIVANVRYLRRGTYWSIQVIWESILKWVSESRNQLLFRVFSLNWSAKWRVEYFLHLCLTLQRKCLWVLLTWLQLAYVDHSQSIWFVLLSSLGCNYSWELHRNQRYFELFLPFSIRLSRFDRGVSRGIL